LGRSATGKKKKPLLTIFYEKKLNLVSFIKIYVTNFLPHIPYTVVLPEDVQVGRNMLQNKTMSLKQLKNCCDTRFYSFHLKILGWAHL
jgi:hypothetical protein